MTFVKQNNKGEWVVMVRGTTNTAGRKYKHRPGGMENGDLHTTKRDFFLVRTSGSSNYITLGRVTFPNELLGKRIRFKAILLDEEEDKCDGEIVEYIMVNGRKINVFRETFLKRD